MIASTALPREVARSSERRTHVPGQARPALGRAHPGLGHGHAEEPALAVDGLSEWLDILVAEVGSVRDDPLGDDASLHLQVTDLDAQRMLRIEPDGLTYQPAPEESTTAARGRGAVLLLAVTRRKTAAEADVEISGAARFWQTWLDRTPFQFADRTTERVAARAIRGRRGFNEGQASGSRRRDLERVNRYGLAWTGDPESMRPWRPGCS